MNCKNIKIKLNKQIICKITNKPIDLKKCSIHCKNYEFKIKNAQYFQKNCAIKDIPIRKKSKKISKLEKNRFSIFDDDKFKCRICGSTHNLTWHEIYDGKNRQNSMIWGLCLRLCWSCHMKYQEDKNFNEYWHKNAQIKFMNYYHKTADEFLEIFKKNYL